MSDEQRSLVRWPYCAGLELPVNLNGLRSVGECWLVRRVGINIRNDYDSKKQPKLSNHRRSVHDSREWLTKVCGMCGEGALYTFHSDSAAQILPPPSGLRFSALQPPVDTAQFLVTRPWARRSSAVVHPGQGRRLSWSYWSSRAVDSRRLPAMPLRLRAALGRRSG
jgi:hypothetical protein